MQNTTTLHIYRLFRGCKRFLFTADHLCYIRDSQRALRLRWGQPGGHGREDIRGGAAALNETGEEKAIAKTRKDGVRYACQVVCTQLGAHA